ncbi:unnamed protein product [Effrenium voratum]|nr:unnamed protein product [Effrenium voratum]
MARMIGSLLLLGGLRLVAGDVCPDDVEVDLCDTNPEQFSGSTGMTPNLSLLLLVLALAQPGRAKSWALLLPAVVLPSMVAGLTCGDVKDFYKTNQCCGSATKELGTYPGAPTCPYNFQKPACSMAGPQTPRDLTTGAMGDRTPKAITLTDTQANSLPLVNVHFHYGAEHKSDAYSDGTDSQTYDSSRRLATTGTVRPGWMCTTSSLNSTQLQAYTFQYCKGQVEVGKSYEIHYVHSSAGMDANETDDVNADNLADGLGGAANGRGLLNPMIVVQAQIFQIVNGAATVDDMLHGWTVVGHTDSVMYSGSTTGTSHDNSVCSPYAISWHVDKACHQVSPESFDNLCKQMRETYGMDGDLYPHGSRILVDKQHVVQSQYVVPLQ